MKQIIAYVDGSVKEHKGFYYMGYAYYENMHKNRHGYIRIPINEIFYQQAVIKAELLGFKLAMDNGYTNIITDNVAVHTYVMKNHPEINIIFKCRFNNKADKLSKKYKLILGIA